MERSDSVRSTATAVLPLIVANAARGLIIPVYSAYSSTMLALQGYSGLEIGAGLSLAKLLEVLGFPLAGVLTDRGFYRALIGLSVALVGLAGLIVWLRPDIVGVVAAYALMSLSLSLWVPSRNRAMAALLPFALRGRGIALVSIAFNFSRIVGPLIFAYYFAGKGARQYQLGFLTMGVPSLVSAILAYTMLRSRLDSLRGRRVSLAALLSPPNSGLRLLYLYAVLSRASTGAWMALMGAVLVSGLGLPEEAPGVYTSITAASWLLIGYFSGSLADRIGMRASLLLAEAAFTTSLLIVSLIPFLGSAWMLAIVFAAVLEAFAFSTYVSALNKLLTTAKHVGVETGRLNMFVSIASMLGVYMAGHAYEYSPLLVPGTALALHLLALLPLQKMKVMKDIA